jgi:hypothetical protein
MSFFGRDPARAGVEFTITPRKKLRVAKAEAMW